MKILSPTTTPPF